MVKQELKYDSTFPNLDLSSDGVCVPSLYMVDGRYSNGNKETEMHSI